VAKRVCRFFSTKSCAPISSHIKKAYVQGRYGFAIRILKHADVGRALRKFDLDSEVSPRAFPIRRGEYVYCSGGVYKPLGLQPGGLILRSCR
jgi:hypothetical protein